MSSQRYNPVFYISGKASNDRRLAIFMVIDFAAAAILICCIIKGEKRGVIESFASAFGWLFSLFFTFLYSPALASFLIQNTALKSTISDVALSRLKTMISNGDISSIAGAISPDFPAVVSKALANSANSALERAARPLADSLAETVISALAFIIMIFVVKFIIRFAERLIRRLHRAKVVGTVDGILGMLFGILKGGVLIYLLTSLLILTATVTAYQPLVETLQASMVVDTLNSHDLLFFGKDIVNGIELPEVKL